MSDIVERLRAWAKNADLSKDGLVMQAADEIARLRDGYATMLDSIARIMSEPCGDEQHCTCVPLLKIEITRLHDIIRELRREWLPYAMPDYWAAKGLVEQDVLEAAWLERYEQETERLLTPKETP
jgi:hypothetical protein